MQLNIRPNKNIKLLQNLYYLSEEESFYKKYKVRFPAELIIDKMLMVNLALDEVLNIKDNMDCDDQKRAKIIFDYIKYLDDLNDALLLTIKALTPYPEKQNDEKEVDKWLKKYNANSYTKFKDATFSDNDFIRVSSNNIKHDDVRVNFMSLINHNQKNVYGFYLSDILDEYESSGPKPEIHKPYKNTTTAFSFNHFLLRTAGVVALNFYWLNKIIFNKTKKKPHSDNTILSFFSKLKGIEHEFFPDEYNVKYAHIQNNKEFITVLYQKYSSKENFDTIQKINLTLKARVGKSEKLPYVTLINQRRLIKNPRSAFDYSF